MVNEKALELIKNEKYKQANEFSFKLFQKKKVDEFLEINNLLLEKNYTPALLLRGYYHLVEDIHHDNGDYGEKYFNKYLEQRPDSTTVLFQKAVALQVKEKEKEGEELLDNLIENYKETPYDDEILTCESKEKLCEIKLIYLFEKQLKEEIINYANELLREYPDNSLAMLIKAKILCANNENQEALDIIDKCLKKQKSIEGIIIKGDIYINLKEYAKAVKCFDIGISTLGKKEQHLTIEWYHKKGLCLIQLQKYEEAIKCLNKTIDIIREIEINIDLNENGINLLKECEKEKQELLNLGVADVKYSKYTFNLNKLFCILLVLTILLQFIHVNSIIKTIVFTLLLITLVTIIARKIYEIYKI